VERAALYGGPRAALSLAAPLVVQLLFVTSTIVFAYSPLHLTACIYRNSDIFISDEN